MTRRNILSLFAVLAVSTSASATVVKLTWDQLPPLPPSSGQTKQPGVAGPFAGVHGDALIVAGGANFPDRLPWEGGAKIWWDDIWVMENLSATPRWVTDRTFKLPRRLGYGISVNTPEGVLCAGGHDAERAYADVFLLSWDATAREVRRTTLPSMPKPLTYMAAAMIGRTLYVAGGQHAMKGDTAPTAVFWSLDLSKRDQPADFTWKVLPSWPGPARILAVAAAQRGPAGEELFLFSGRKPEAGQPTRILSDGYAFDPRTRTWRTLPEIGDGSQNGLSVMAGTAAAVGDREVLLFGGDRGALFRNLEAHDLAIADRRARLERTPANGREALEREIETRLGAKKKIYETHPGFAREVLAFNTRTNTWRVAGSAAFAPQVTTVAVKHRDTILIPSGEIRPGVRTPEIVRVVPVTK